MPPQIIASLLLKRAVDECCACSSGNNVALTCIRSANSSCIGQTFADAVAHSDHHGEEPPSSTGFFTEAYLVS